MLIAQITDLHIKPPGRLAYRRVDTAAYLERAVAAVNALDPAPAVIVATGDLVDAGTPEEYGLLRELLQPLRTPVLLLPGNHDARAPLAASFPDHRYLRSGGDTVDYAIADWPVRIVALDSTEPGEAGGRVSAEQLAWLDATLAEARERPTVLIMHHPPFATGIAHMDRIGLEDAPALAAVVGRHPQVERVLCGHLHRAIQARWAGTIASTAPSTAHQVTLDLRADGPSSFTLEPPGFQLHLWRGGDGIVSHTATIDRFEGPYPFHDGGRLID